MDQAFKYIKENGGIDTEESYPYDGEDETCQYNKKGKGAWDVGFTDIPEGDEKALQQAVGTVGPVSIAIDAAHKGFMFYHHGKYFTVWLKRNPPLSFPAHNIWNNFWI